MRRTSKRVQDGEVGDGEVTVPAYDTEGVDPDVEQVVALTEGRDGDGEISGSPWVDRTGGLDDLAAPGAVSPPPAAGRVVETVVDAVQHPVETARNAWRGARQQAGRARDAARNWWDGMPWNR